MQRCLDYSSSIQTAAQRPQLPLLWRKACVRCFARKQAKKKREGKGFADYRADTAGAVDLEELAQVMPAAPSPRQREEHQAPALEPAPDDIYAVRPATLQPGQPAPWTWDGDEDDKPAPAPAAAVPAWNPKTGFMRSTDEQPSPSSMSSTDSPVILSSSSNYSNSTQASAMPSTSSQNMNSSFSLPPADVVGDVVIASKDQVLQAAFGTGFSLLVIGFLLRSYADMNAAAVLGTDPAVLKDLLRLPMGLETFADAAATVLCAASVTGARFALMQVWPDFKESTDRSNKQVLTKLNIADIALISFLAGVPEELLFRSGMIPATYPDWRGVLIAAVVFGLLHNSGGRNLAFAGWATGVGALYGAAFLATGNIWVAALAHTAANFSSAVIWKSQQSQT